MLFASPQGETFATLSQAFEHEVAMKQLAAGPWSNRVALTFLQKFLNESCTEKAVQTQDQQRTAVITSAWTDWLRRGDHPVLVNMSLQVYAMWV